MPHYFRFSEQSKYGIQDIDAFNDACFPIRRPHRLYDRYRLVDNPFRPTNFDFCYGVEKEGDYVAQMLTMPAPLSLNGSVISAFWGQDYIVAENSRGEGIGKELANYYLKNDYYIAVGFSPKSAVIHQKMGARKIGYLDFYRKWASPLFYVKFLLHRGLKIKAKKISEYSFPMEVSGFKRIFSGTELHAPTLNWNKNTIETLRNAIYFDWRFFYKPDRYFVYQATPTSNKNAAYFVVKPYFYKGVNWLKVVDYRYDIQNIDEFEAILNALEILRKKHQLFGIILSSSLKETKDFVEYQGFERYKHEVVLTTYPFGHKETDDAHNHFVISFADSDMDMHNYLGRFNYGEDY